MAQIRIETDQLEIDCEYLVILKFANGSTGTAKGLAVAGADFDCQTDADGGAVIMECKTDEDGVCAVNLKATGSCDWSLPSVEFLKK